MVSTLEVSATSLPRAIFDQAITIRTIVMNRGRYSAQAGAGIVADSVPTNEYQEIRNKAEALLKALQFAKEEL